MKFYFISHEAIIKKQLEKIAELKATVWPYPPTEQLRWMIDNHIKEDIHLLLYGGENSETLMGYVALNSIEVDGNSSIGIGNVCVHRDCQGQGYGILLMKIAESYIINSHSDAWLLCKPTVAPFYERCGWARIKDKFTFADEIINCQVYKLWNRMFLCRTLNPHQSSQTEKNGTHRINRIF